MTKRGAWSDSMWLSVFMAVSLVLSLDIRPVSARGPREDFLRDYREPAVAVYEAYQHVRMKYRLTTPTADGRVKHTGPFEVTITPDGWKLTDSGKGGKPGLVMARNKDYSFTLNSTSKGKLVSALETAPKGDTSTFLCPHTDTALGRPYLASVADPQHTPVYYADEQFGDTPCKVYRQRMTNTHPVTGKLLAFERAYYFAPQENWVCRGFRSWLPDDNLAREERYTYKRVAGFPLPALSSVESWSTFKDPPKPLSMTSGLDVLDFNEQLVAPPGSELHLSGYGISEPALAPKKPAGWNWFWVAGGVVAVLALLGLTVRRLMQKARA